MFAVSLCYGFTEGLTDVHERIRHTGFQQMVTRCVCLLYVQVSMIFVLNEHKFRGSALVATGRQVVGRNAQVHSGGTDQ